MPKHIGVKVIFIVVGSIFISCLPASIHAYPGPIMESSKLATIQTNTAIENFGIQEIDEKWPPLHQSQGIFNGGIIKKPIHITPGRHIIRISITTNHLISIVTLSSNIALNAEPGKEYIVQIKTDDWMRNAFLWIEEKNTRKLVVAPIPVIRTKFSNVKN